MVFVQLSGTFMVATASSIRPHVCRNIYNMHAMKVETQADADVVAVMT
jgi:hypothetical protein